MKFRFWRLTKGSDGEEILPALYGDNYSLCTRTGH